MPENQNQIEIRSDEVQEIMNHVPNWMIRWGITLIFVLLLTFLLVAWMIKYPDVIKGTVQVTTEVPPIKLVNKNSGKIDQLYFKENTLVYKNDVIATLNNPLSIQAKQQLDSIHAAIEQQLAHGEMPTLELTNTSHTYGTLQTEFTTLVNSITKYKNLLDERKTAFQVQNLNEQIRNHTILKSVTYQQLNTAKGQFKKAEEKLNSDQVLFEKGVISKMEFYEKEKAFFVAKSEIENLKKTAVQHSITIANLKKELNELEFEYDQNKKDLKLEIQNALQSIENGLNNWMMNYQIIAPIDGKLTYVQSLNENEYIEAGKEVFAIIPDNQQYIAHVKIPQTGYGKIETGQTVRMKLDNFPYQEYGQVNGVVKAISLIPNENNYLVKIDLPQGLISSYNKTLKFTPEMSGTAEIITKDLRLIERIFNQFRKVFDP